MKCVLLHNGNAFGSIPLGHSTTLKEKYSEIKFVLEKNSYYEHNWIICVDLKMVGFLLGLQCSVANWYIYFKFGIFSKCLVYNFLIWYIRKIWYIFVRGFS